MNDIRDKELDAFKKVVASRAKNLEKKSALQEALRRVIKC